MLRSDLGAFFSLSVNDLRWLRSYRGAPNRLGLAVSLCGLRYLGFIPEDLTAAPGEVIDVLTKRVGVSPRALERYAREVDGRLRRLHIGQVIAQAGWRLCGRGEWKGLRDWLVDRAIEHDSPQLLFRQLLEHLRAERIVRPGILPLLRAVGSARVAALREINWRWRGLLTPDRCSGLDAMIETDPRLGVAPIVWLDQGCRQLIAASH